MRTRFGKAWWFEAWRPFDVVAGLRAQSCIELRLPLPYVSEYPFVAEGVVLLLPLHGALHVAFFVVFFHTRMFIDHIAMRSRPSEP